MNLLKLVLLELRYRPLSAFLTAGVCGIALSVIILTVGTAEVLSIQTKQIQRDIGLNIRILPQETDLNRYWLDGFAQGTLSEDVMQRLEGQEVANRLIPVLQQAIEWGETTAILTGIGDEFFAGGKKMKPVFGSKLGTDEKVILGASAAAAISANVGDEIEIRGTKLVVSEILRPEGSLDDARVHASLPVVQSLLNLDGKINEIRALECHCETSIEDPEAYLQGVLGDILPGAQIVRHSRIADARRKQRQLAHRIASTIAPLMIVMSAVGVFALAFLNAHERRNEFGLFATMGIDEWWIVGVSCLRSALLGLIGGAVGGAIGVSLMQWVVGSGGWLAPSWDLKAQLPPDFAMEWLLASGILGCLIGMLGSVIPAVVSSRREPAAALAVQ